MTGRRCCRRRDPSRSGPDAGRSDRGARSRCCGASPPAPPGRAAAPVRRADPFAADGDQPHVAAPRSDGVEIVEQPGIDQRGELGGGCRSVVVSIVGASTTSDLGVGRGPRVHGSGCRRQRHATRPASRPASPRSSTPIGRRCRGARPGGRARSQSSAATVRPGHRWQRFGGGPQWVARIGAYGKSRNRLPGRAVRTAGGPPADRWIGDGDGGDVGRQRSTIGSSRRPDPT